MRKHVTIYPEVKMVRTLKQNAYRRKGDQKYGIYRGDTPTRVLANGRGFLRHGRTPQRAITSPLHSVTSLPLSRLFCGCLF